MGEPSLEHEWFFTSASPFWNNDLALQASASEVDDWGVDLSEEACVVCRRCNQAFVGNEKSAFAGMRSFSCPDCGKDVTYPLSHGSRIFWWALAVVTATAGVTANAFLHDGYSWIPGGVGLLSFVVLCIDVGLQRRVAIAHHVIQAPSLVAHASPTTRMVEPKQPREAAPVYVAALTVLILFSVLSSVLGMLAVAGLNNAYSHKVVLQEASPATTQDSYGSALDLTPSGGDLCSDGEDYNRCLNMHIAMYNSVCVGTTLTTWAQSTCKSLSDFIDDVRARDGNCGAGCTTQANADGHWGWEYLRPSPARTSITNDNAVSEITYEEHCLFSLGPIQIGNCSGEPDPHSNTGGMPSAGSR